MKPILIAGLVTLLGTSTARAQQVPLASNPHGALPAGADCANCHTATAWKSIKAKPDFDHNRSTGFPLNGRHATAACGRCHLGLRFDQPKVTEAQCTSCHADVHRGNMAGECIRCHTTASFRDVPTAAIHARTGFPLTGAHLQAPCESCHRTERGGAYTAVARDCVTCHRASLAVATQVIDHSGFPADCSQCHAPLSWSGGAGFDHVTVSRGFQLVGMHAQLRCTNCHVMPGSALKFNPHPSGNDDCVACHQPDYQRVHAASGFPTTCTACHDQSSWASSFDHDGKFFPINSGAHRGKWSNCATCHTTPGDYKSFTCFTCHEHAQSGTDSHHQGVRNYVYDSAACYQCHPKGRH